MLKWTTILDPLSGVIVHVVWISTPTGLALAVDTDGAGAD